MSIQKHNHPHTALGKSLTALLALLILASWIGDATVSAASRPKIPPRNRGSEPVVSPLLKPDLAPIPEQSDALVPVDSIHPVSWHGDSDAEQHTRPATDSHPAKISPVPMLPNPATDSETPTLREHSSLENSGTLNVQSNRIEPTVAAQPKTKHRRGKTEVAEAPIQGTVMVQVETNAVPIASNGPAEKSSRKNKKAEKPVVHFPEMLQAPPYVATQAYAPQMEAHFYPVGYRPYTPSWTEASKAHLKAALVHYERAIYYANQRRYDEARAEYTEALGEHPTFADAYVGLSSVAMPKQDWESVTEYARQALSMKEGFMEPSNITQARFNMAMASCVANDYDEAKKYYKDVKIARHPAAEQLWTYMEKHCKP